MADANLIADLPRILDAHARWRRRGPGGTRADLAGADLAGAGLARANLAGADLAGAGLARANLAGADLARAGLARANLAGADLAHANLAGAYLADANLAGANLVDANLAGAGLARANLAGADLARAGLARANLAGADLARANLAGANLAGADLVDARWGEYGIPDGPVTLPDGAFRAYKLCRGPDGSRVIVTLEIPEDAQRVAPIVGRKCRASRARVIALSSGDAAFSWHAATGPDADLDPGRLLIYSVGKEMIPDSYDPSPFVECSHGIHFFISRREAERYA